MDYSKIRPLVSEILNNLYKQQFELLATFIVFDFLDYQNKWNQKFMVELLLLLGDSKNKHLALMEIEPRIVEQQTNSRVSCKILTQFLRVKNSFLMFTRGDIAIYGECLADITQAMYTRVAQHVSNDAVVLPCTHVVPKKYSLTNFVL